VHNSHLDLYVPLLALSLAFHLSLPVCHLFSPSRPFPFRPSLSRPLACGWPRRQTRIVVAFVRIIVLLLLLVRLYDRCCSAGASQLVSCGSRLHALPAAPRDVFPPNQCFGFQPQAQAKARAHLACRAPFATLRLKSATNSNEQWLGADSAELDRVAQLCASSGRRTHALQAATRTCAIVVVVVVVVSLSRLQQVCVWSRQRWRLG